MKWILLWIGTMIISWDHDIHVSVSDIDIQDDNVQMVVKTYLDDLQKAIGLEPGSEVPEGYTSAEQMIGEYIMQTISIKVNERVLELNIDDLSASQDAVWITLSSTEAFSILPKDLVLESTFLLEVYDDQTNVINVKWPTGKNSLMLKGKKTSQLITLK